MAGSRLEKLGTVYTRVRDLLRAGVIKQKAKPIWFDVYTAFPPKRQPTYEKPPTGKLVEDKVPAIFYQEDLIRAKFYEAYGSGPELFELSRTNFKSTCQRFVEKYTELQKMKQDKDADELFEAAGKALLSEGIILRRKGIHVKLQKVSLTENYDSGVNIKDSLEETPQRQIEPKDQPAGQSTSS